MLVLLKYIATNVDQANGADTFTSSGAIDGETSVTVTTVDSASGGSQRETIESIKLNAPLDYATQGRCVTANDYMVFARKLAGFAKIHKGSPLGSHESGFRIPYY